MGSEEIQRKTDEWLLSKKERKALRKMANKITVVPDRCDYPLEYVINRKKKNDS